MWKEKRVDEERLQSYVVKGFITQEEYDQITATPQEV
ncbi:XkdX family protein [Sutcliffiella horikoshii]|nr:XkdX family protein [Sutcliffiella horikoshii]